MRNADGNTLRRSLALVARELDDGKHKQRPDLFSAPRQAQGAPLVLLHPFSMCSDVWQPIVPLLAREHEVVALSMPGHFGGDPLPPRFSHSVEAAVDLLERKLDALGIQKAHIVGNSLGGWFAIELARRQRAHSVVALAPGGGWALGGPEHRRLMRRIGVTGALLQVGGPVAGLLSRYALLRRATLGHAVANPTRLSPSEARMFIESAWRCSAYFNVLRCMATQALPKPLSPWPCPIRLVWGDADKLLPMDGYSEHFRQILPHAEWVVLKGVGHVPMYDDPDSVARSILDVTSRKPPTTAR